MRWLTFPRQGPGRKTHAEAQDREQERRARAKRRRAGIPHPNAGFNTQPPSLPLPLARARRGERPRSAYTVCATADLPLRELQQSLTSFEKLDPIARPRNPYARSFSVATRSRSSAIAHDACILQLSNCEFVDGVQFGNVQNCTPARRDAGGGLRRSGEAGATQAGGLDEKDLDARAEGRSRPCLTT